MAHKTLTDHARQMIAQVRRWLPHRQIVVTADSSYAVLELDGPRFIVGEARLRNFHYFGGVGAWELVRDLAVVDCDDRLKRFTAGQVVPTSVEQMAALRVQTEGWWREGQMCSDLPHQP